MASDYSIPGLLVWIGLFPPFRWILGLINIIVTPINIFLYVLSLLKTAIFGPNFKMEEEIAQAIYEKAVEGGDKVPQDTEGFQEIEETFKEFFGEKNYKDLFEGPHYMPSIYLLSQEEMISKGAGGRHVWRWKNNIIQEFLR